MPTIIKIIVIPADSEADLRIEEIERGNYLKLGDLVGGTFEVLTANDPPCSMYFNEDGRRLELEENERATLLLRTMRPEFSHEAPLVGDVLIVGHPDGRGNDTSVPEQLPTILFTAQLFAVEYQQQEGGEWTRMRSTFDTWMLAYLMAGYSLASSHFAAARVIPL